MNNNDQPVVPVVPSIPVVQSVFSPVAPALGSARSFGVPVCGGTPDVPVLGGAPVIQTPAVAEYLTLPSATGGGDTLIAARKS